MAESAEDRILRLEAELDEALDVIDKYENDDSTQKRLQESERKREVLEARCAAFEQEAARMREADEGRRVSEAALKAQVEQAAAERDATQKELKRQRQDFENKERELAR